MITRTQVAQYVANNIQSGDINNRQKAIKIAADWLNKTGKKRQASYLVKDITAELAKNGYVYVIITSANPLDKFTINSIKDYISRIFNTQKYELNLVIDKGLIGGAKIETPEGILDTTIKARLARIVEGVSV